MNKFKKLGYLAVGSATLLTANIASAATVDTIDTSGIGNSLVLGNSSPVDLAVSVVNWVLGLLALVAVIMILIGGFRWMTAGGNEEKVESAKKLLIAALIGLVIILAAWGLSTYAINNLLNFTGA
ncbi:MAG: pilin [bacterium]|nr:pilin [bacterium]